MKQIPLIIFAVGICVCFASCDSKTETKKSSAFSDIEKYFDTEIKSLQQAGVSLTKNLAHGNKTEKITVENPDWKTELAPFTETIANQSARIQSYSSDSLRDGTSITLVLNAKDASAAVQRVAVYSTNGINDSIVIMKHVANSYYSSTDTLTYYGGGNYSIKAENLPGFGKKIGFVLEGIAASNVNH